MCVCVCVFKLRTVYTQGAPSPGPRFQCCLSFSSSTLQLPAVLAPLFGAYVLVQEENTLLAVLLRFPEPARSLGCRENRRWLEVGSTHPPSSFPAERRRLFRCVYNRCCSRSLAQQVALWRSPRFRVWFSCRKRQSRPPWPVCCGTSELVLGQVGPEASPISWGWSRPCECDSVLRGLGLGPTPPRDGAAPTMRVNPDEIQAVRGLSCSNAKADLPLGLS